MSEKDDDTETLRENQRKRLEEPMMISIGGRVVFDPDDPSASDEEPASEQLKKLVEKRGAANGRRKRS